jgi:magnesium-protoporphyrin IX monomethyl ester (oxidative) cyclase
VFLTHSLTVAERDDFYGLLGIDASRFDDAVITATNRSARQAFPMVFRLDDGRFLAQRDRVVTAFRQLAAAGAGPATAWRPLDRLRLRLTLAVQALALALQPMEASR